MILKNPWKVIKNLFPFIFKWGFIDITFENTFQSYETASEIHKVLFRVFPNIEIYTKTAKKEKKLIDMEIWFDVVWLFWSGHFRVVIYF